MHACAAGALAGMCMACMRSQQMGMNAAAGLSWGIYFTAYNAAKQRWQRLRGEESLPAPLHLLSAAEAGCVVCARSAAQLQCSPCRRRVAL